MKIIGQRESLASLKWKSAGWREAQQLGKQAANREPNTHRRLPSPGTPVPGIQHPASTVGNAHMCTDPHRHTDTTTTAIIYNNSSKKKEEEEAGETV